MTVPPEVLAQLPAWVIALLFALDKVLGLERSRRDQGRRIGALRRDLDEIAADLKVKLRRNQPGSDGE